MAAGSSGSDFLYEVGVDLTKANADLRQWAATTAPSMLKDLSEPVQIKVGYAAAKTNIQNFVAYATKALKDVPPINVTFNFSGASRSLNAFIANFKKNASAIGELEAAMGRLEQRGAGLATAYAPFQQSMTGIRSSLQGATRETQLYGQTSEAASERASKLGAVAEKNTAAVDYLGKIMIADVAKIMAWGAAFEGMSAAGRLFTDSLKEAGEVQMEQTLQRLYSSTVNVSQALSNATVIARAWGGDIVDVQQAIGLWTKQTNDLNEATLLANKGEEMSRASGIATLDVYKDSLAIGRQMGLTYGQLPGVYDQIAQAALKLGEKLRDSNEESRNGTEAMKDLFQGLARFSAVGSSAGFVDLKDKLKGTAAIIALVANQITAMGDNGKTAATNLATMFGALQQGGLKRKAWEEKLGVDAFKDADSLMASMQKHMSQLMQAQANGQLGVRPQQVETLATMLKSLKQVKELMDQIETGSAGKLDFVALAEMGTYQAQVERLKTALQALEITIGNELLPTAQAFVTWLAGTGLPTIEHMTPAILSGAKAVTELAGAWLLWQAGAKVSNYWNDILVKVQANTAAIKQNALAQESAQRAGFASAEALAALQAKLSTYQAGAAEATATTQLMATAFRALGAEAGLTNAQLQTLLDKEVLTGEAADRARAQISEETTAVKGLQMELFAAGSQMQLFTDAETRGAGAATALKTEVANAGAAAEGSVGGWRAAAAGIGMVAETATRTLAPLMAIYSVMQMIDSWNAGSSKEANAVLGTQSRGQAAISGSPNGLLDTFMQPTKVGGVPVLPFNLGAGLQAVNAWRQGNLWQMGGNGGGVVPQWLNDAMLGGNSPVKQQYVHDLTDWSSPGGKTKDNLQALEEDEKAYLAQSRAVNGATKQFEDLQKFLQKINDAAAKQVQKQPMGAPDEGHYFANIPGKTSGGGNPALTQVNQTAAAFDALAKKENEVAAAADADIKATEMQLKQNPTSISLQNQLAAAFQRKEQAYNALSVAANAYVGKLTSEIKADETALQSGKLSAAQKKQYSEALVKAENDLTKAEGDAALAAAKHREAMVEADTTLASYTIKTIEAKNGVANWQQSLKNIETGLASAKANGLVPWMSALGTASGQLNVLKVGLQSTLSVIEQKLPHATTLITQLKQALHDVGAEMGTVKTDTTTATDSIGDIISKLKELNDTLLEGNLKDIANILGYNKQTVEYLTQTLDLNKQITQQNQQILGFQKQLGDLQTAGNFQGAQQVAQAIQLATADQQQLQVKLQIAQLENKILAIRSNPLYSAFDSEIDKMGSGFLDKAVQKLFGGGGATGGMQVIHQFFSGVAENLVGGWWKNVSENLTTGLMGGSSPVQQLQQMGTKLEATVAQGFNPAVTTFGAYVGSFVQGISNLGAILTGGSSNVGTGNIPGVNPNGFSWAGVPDLGGTSSNYQATEQEYGITNPLSVGQGYEAIQTIADNTTQTNTYLATMAGNSVAAATTINQAVAAPGNSSIFSGTGLGGGGFLLDAGFSPTGLNLGGLGGSAGSSGGMFGSILNMLGLGGVAAGASGGGGILGGLGGLTGGSPLGALMLALGAGSAFGGIFGSNTGKAGVSGRETNGMIGALLGGGASLGVMAPWLLAGFSIGPLGWGLIAASALLGGFGGSMFGDHFPISDEPDIGEPVVGGVDYGQFVANMTGQAGSFNGSTIDPMSQFAGPQDAESYQLEQDVQKVLASPSQYPSQLVQMAHQLQKYNPGNEPYGFSINGEKDDVFTLHSGASVNVQTFQGLVQQFMQLFGKTPQKPLAPILSINGANSPNWYNTPGLTNSEFTQMTQSSWGSYHSSTPYNVPGYSSGGSGAPPPIQGNFVRSMPYVGSGGGGGGNGAVTVQLLLNGKLLAQVVNAYNAQYLLNSGKSIQQIPVI